MPGDAVTRLLMRCKACGHQWSVELEVIYLTRCACGGELAEINLQAEIDKLPYSPFDPNKK